MVRRLVGYYEYGNALADLDKLVSLATEEDLTAIDEIIADRHEFDVYLSLPESFTPKTNSESKVDKPNGANQIAGNEFRQTGLAWVTALARIEFGAMIAGFTEQPVPFSDVNPKSHDYGNAMQLLLEGVTGHYKGLVAKSPQGAKATVQGALALSRRTRIARAMLTPLLAPGASEYSAAQAYVLGKYKSNLDDVQELVNTRLKLFLAQWQTSKETHTTSGFVEACASQVRAEKRELAAGTATVNFYGGE